MAVGLRLRDGCDATMEQIKAQGGDKSQPAKTTLRWITHAERPLRANELCHALAVKLGFTDFDIGNLPRMSTFMSCCQGLVIVVQEESTVRLIHFTLQQFDFFS